MSLTSINAAVQLVEKAMSALNGIRERSRSSQDTELNAHISTLYDELFALKEAVIRLTEENEELRRELRRTADEKHKPELKRVGSANFYFDGDKGPCCQPCYEANGILTVLTEQEEWNGGIRRQCLHCKEYFYEKPKNRPNPSGGGPGGPNRWMG